jgi:hypothetical protein
MLSLNVCGFDMRRQALELGMDSRVRGNDGLAYSDTEPTITPFT